MFELVKHPSSSLLTRATIVESFDEDLRTLVESMLDVMYSNAGVGLAAPQLGVTKRVVLIDPSGGDDADQLTVMINPTITWRSLEAEVGPEGCLSLPGMVVQVKRTKIVEVEYFDVDAIEHKVRLDGLAARIVQHEVDHLDGIMMFDRAGDMMRTLAKKVLDRNR